MVNCLILPLCNPSLCAWLLRLLRLRSGTNESVSKGTNDIYLCTHFRGLRCWISLRPKEAAFGGRVFEQWWNTVLNLQSTNRGLNDWFSGIDKVIGITVFLFFFPLLFWSHILPVNTCSLRLPPFQSLQSFNPIYILHARLDAILTNLPVQGLLLVGTSSESYSNHVAQSWSPWLSVRASYASMHPFCPVLLPSPGHMYTPHTLPLSPTNRSHPRPFSNGSQIFCLLRNRKFTFPLLTTR